MLVGKAAGSLFGRVFCYGLTRRETRGSICKALLLNMVNTAGSGRSKQVWHGQDTRIIQGQAWVDDRQTISRGLGGENKPGKRAGIRTQEIRLGIQGKRFVG